MVWAVPVRSRKLIEMTLKAGKILNRFFRAISIMRVLRRTLFLFIKSVACSEKLFPPFLLIQHCMLKPPKANINPTFA